MMPDTSLGNQLSVGEIYLQPPLHACEWGAALMPIPLVRQRPGDFGGMVTNLPVLLLFI